MNRRSSPFSRSRSPIPGWFASRFSIRSVRVAPDASTAFSPPVYVRRIVGIRTSIDIASSVSLVRSAGRRRVLDELDVLFGDDPVDDSVGPELHRALTI